MSRPGAATRVRDEWAAGAAGPAAVDDLLVDYLSAEQRLGRVSETADCAMLGLAIVGTVHHLLMTGSTADGEQQDLVERLVTAVMGSTVTPPP
jgi:hypothetical protein